MTSAHFIYIPVCILIGVIFGWILGGRAARDAYMAELKRREAKAIRDTKGPDHTKGTKGTKDTKDTKETKGIM